MKRQHNPVQLPASESSAWSMKLKWTAELRKIHAVPKTHSYLITFRIKQKVYRA